MVVEGAAVAAHGAGVINSAASNLANKKDRVQEAKSSSTRDGTDGNNKPTRNERIQQKKRISRIIKIDLKQNHQSKK